MMAVEIIMPKLGLTMEEGTVVAWRKQDGEAVAAGEVLLEVETDKATVEVPAPADGFLKLLVSAGGAALPVGTVLAYLGDGAVDSGPTAGGTAPTQTVAEDAERVRATPAARRLAREKGIDLTQVAGTGPEGRIKEGDVLSFQPAQGQAKVASPLAKKTAQGLGVDISVVEGTGPAGRVHRADVLMAASGTTAAAEKPAARPATSVSYGLPSQRVALSKIRATTAERMTQSFQTAPHFALSVEVDMTEATRMREKLMDSVVMRTGKRLTFTAILVRCVAQVLGQHPDVNASFLDGAIEQWEDVNLGVAMSLKQGLMVPVIRNADRKTMVEISSALGELESRSKEMKFRPEELSGGTFTISNLGMYGISEFTAIINPPESAILAVGQIDDKPVVRDGAVVVRPIMKLTLSIDHRALDGAAAAIFLRDIKTMMENPYLLV
jgi:pyruvate dehydrogenase E2 component (dihydrolipoamide acetyltransferase)